MGCDVYLACKFCKYRTPSLGKKGEMHWEETEILVTEFVKNHGEHHLVLVSDCDEDFHEIIKYEVDNVVKNVSDLVFEERNKYREEWCKRKCENE